MLLNVTDEPYTLDGEGEDVHGNFSQYEGCIEDLEMFTVCINGIEHTLFFGDPKDLKEGEAQLAPAIATYCLSFIAGLIGNLMIVCAVLQTDVRRSATNIYLLSLAISDAIFLLVCVPYKLATDFVNGWGFGSGFCKIFAYVEMVSTVAAIYNLVAVSFERYIAISHPMKARYVVTIGNAKRLITVICIFSFVSGVPLLYFTKVDTMRYFINQTQEQYMAQLCNQPELTKSELLYFAIYRMVLMLAVPGILMTFCYSRVILALRRSTKVIDPAQIHMQSARNTRTEESDQRAGTLSSRKSTDNNSVGAAAAAIVRFKRRSSLCIHESRQQVIKMLIVIVLVFFLSWAPKLTFELLEDAGVHMFTNEALWIKTLSDLLPYLQCCINPYIYCFMSANFRQYIKRTAESLMHLCCSKREDKLSTAAVQAEQAVRKSGSRKTRNSFANSKSGRVKNWEGRKDPGIVKRVRLCTESQNTNASSLCVKPSEEDTDLVLVLEEARVSTVMEAKSSVSTCEEPVDNDCSNLNDSSDLCDKRR